MKKILKEVFYFKAKDDKGVIKYIDPDTFITNLKTVDSEKTDFITDELVKELNMTRKEDIAKCLNNIVIAYMKDKKYDYLMKKIQSSGQFKDFSKFFVGDVKKFIDKLPKAAEDSMDTYGSQRGWNPETTDKMSQYWAKINTSIPGKGNLSNLSPAEAIDFANTMLGNKATKRMDQDAAERFAQMVRDVYKGAGGLNDANLKTLLTSYST